MESSSEWSDNGSSGSYSAGEGAVDEGSLDEEEEVKKKEVPKKLWMQDDEEDEVKNLPAGHTMCVKMKKTWFKGNCITPHLITRLELNVCIYIDWEEFEDALREYGKDTFQMYKRRSSESCGTYNARCI